MDTSVGKGCWLESARQCGTVILVLVTHALVFVGYQIDTFTLCCKMIGSPCFLGFFISDDFESTLNLFYIITNVLKLIFQQEIWVCVD